MLFERTSKGMLPTPAGEALMQRARRVLTELAGVAQLAQELRGEIIGKVRIGLNTDAAFLRLVELQSALKSRYPRLAVEFLGGTTGANLPKLREGRLDACFVSGALDDAVYASDVLREEEMAIAAPSSLREAIGAGGVAELARLPWIHSSPDRIQHTVVCSVFEGHAEQPACAMTANQKDAVLAMVAAGVGLAVTRRKDIERLAGEGRVFALPLPPGAAPASVSLRFACLRGRADEPMLRAVRAEVRTLWQVDGTD